MVIAVGVGALAGVAVWLALAVIDSMLPAVR